MKTSDLDTAAIPAAVADRMRRAKGSEAARRKLNDLDIDGSQVDEMTGYVQFFFRSPRRINAMMEDPKTGEHSPANIPIDGFILDPGNDWALVNWFLQPKKPAPGAKPN